MRHGIKLHSLSWKSLPGPGDFDPPEDEDAPECPECGEPCDVDGMETTCTNEDCDYHSEPDYAQMAEDREAPA